MATFPALTPSSRSLDYGDYSQSTYEAVSGANVRFLYGTDRVVQRLTLGYQFLSETEVQQLLDHYEAQQGSIIPFAVSAEVWAGYTNPPVSTIDYQWRYASALEVNIASPLRYNTTVTLESVPV